MISDMSAVRRAHSAAKTVNKADNIIVIILAAKSGSQTDVAVSDRSDFGRLLFSFNNHCSASPKNTMDQPVLPRHFPR